MSSCTLSDSLALTSQQKIEVQPALFETIQLNNNNERILDEDAYIDTLEHIIARDFYPDLYRDTKKKQYISQFGKKPKPASIKIKNENNDTCNNDHHNKKSSQKTKIKKELEINTKSKSFDDPETPIIYYNTNGIKTEDLSNNLNNDINKNNVHGKNITDQNINNDKNDDSPVTNDYINNNNNTNIDNNNNNLLHYVNGEILSSTEYGNMKNMSLNEFQKEFVSEDNYSFNDLMRKKELYHYEKNSHFYQQAINDKQRNHCIQLLKDSYCNNKNNIDVTKSITLPDQNNDNQNKTMLNSETMNNNLKQMKEIENEKQIIELYKGELEFWKFKPKNNFMFYPTMEDSQYSQHKLIQEFYNKYDIKPECVYENTRFPENFKLESKPSQSLHSELELNVSTPKVNGYSLLQTPQIVPGQKNPNSSNNDDNCNDDVTPIVTWGELGATPMILDDDDRPKGPIFQIPNLPRKDLLTNKLVSKNSSKLRKKQELKLRSIYNNDNNNVTPLLLSSSYSYYSMLNSEHGKKTPLFLRKNKNGNNNIFTPSKRRCTISDLSPAARNLAMKNIGNTTPLHMLREQYSSKNYNRSGNDNKFSSTKSSSIRVENQINDNSVITSIHNEINKKRKIENENNDDDFKKPKSKKSKLIMNKDNTNITSITDGLL